jgi:hypothetical protein
VDEKMVEVAGAFEWGSPKTARSARWVDLPELLMPALAAAGLPGVRVEWL